MNIHMAATRRPEIPRKQVLATLGASPDHRPARRLRRQVETAIRGVEQRADYRSAYRCYPMRIESGRLRLGSDLTLHSTRLAAALQPCERLFVYVVTLGPEVDAYVDHCMRRRPDFGVVVDAAASVAAESMVDRIEQTISEELPPTDDLSLPFSPGHCDWPVRDQRTLFELLPADPAGVSLSADLMMSPRKSVSGVFGAGSMADLASTANPCSSCLRSGCTHRRHPYTERDDDRDGDPCPDRAPRDDSAELCVPTS
jgi:hypothetical protein